jgi:hypothetical protein
MVISIQDSQISTCDRAMSLGTVLLLGRVEYGRRCLALASHASRLLQHKNCCTLYSTTHYEKLLLYDTTLQNSRHSVGVWPLINFMCISLLYDSVHTEGTVIMGRVQSPRVNSRRTHLLFPKLASVCRAQLTLCIVDIYIESTFYT